MRSRGCFISEQGAVTHFSAHAPGHPGLGQLGSCGCAMAAPGSSASRDLGQRDMETRCIRATPKVTHLSCWQERKAEGQAQAWYSSATGSLPLRATLDLAGRSSCEVQ